MEHVSATTGLGFTGFLFPLLKSVLWMSGQPTVRQQGPLGDTTVFAAPSKNTASKRNLDNAAHLHAGPAHGTDQAVHERQHSLDRRRPIASDTSGRHHCKLAPAWCSSGSRHVFPNLADHGLLLREQQVVIFIVVDL